MILSKPRKKHLTEYFPQSKRLKSSDQILLCLLINAEHSLSGYEIAAYTGLSRPTVTNNIKKLIVKGSIQGDPEKKALKYPNRKINHYKISPDGNNFLISLARCINTATGSAGFFLSSESSYSSKEKSEPTLFADVFTTKTIFDQDIEQNQYTLGSMSRPYVLGATHAVSSFNRDLKKIKDLDSN